MDLDRNRYYFLSTYKKDYVEKPQKLVSKIIQEQEFADPIGEGYKQHLFLDETDFTPPDEDGELYLEKFKENYKPIAQVYFQDPLDKETIIKYYIQEGIVSEYQAHYCDVEKDIQFYLERKRKKFSLPNDTEIPLTTYTSHFRDPTKYSRRNLVVIPTDNVEISGRIPVTKISEYTDHIGRFGEFILETNYKRRKLRSQT